MDRKPQVAKKEEHDLVKQGICSILIVVFKPWTLPIILSLFIQISICVKQTVGIFLFTFMVPLLNFDETRLVRD